MICDESFFVNQNNAIKQVSKSNVVFGITNGGTGATTAEQARTNLGVAPTEHTHSIDEIEELQDKLDTYATQTWVAEQISKIAIYDGE